MTIMTDGFSTTIAFPSHASVKFDEIEVQPPGVSGGGAIDTTTMTNTAWRTKMPKRLKTLTEASLVVAYDPAVYDEIIAMVTDNQLITLTFPDNSTIAFWGWLDEFTPGNNVEGERPTADCTIICSNMNDSLAETAPEYTAPA